MVALARGGLDFTDPRLLRQYTGAANRYNVITVVGTNTITNSTAAGFFTELANRGAVVDAAFTADTYKTLANLTGFGLFAGAVGPTAGGAETTTFRITVNGGTAKTFAVTVASGERAGLFAVPMGISPELMTTAAAFFVSGSDLNAGKNTFALNSTLCRVPSWDTISLMGAGCLNFTSSLLVEVKHSQDVTGTSNQERQSGAMYFLSNAA